MLTGQLVFPGKSAVEMLMQHVQEVPEPPSQRTELSVPPALDTIVLACLEKDPARRPRSATELAQQLEACPVESPWTNERARQWWCAHDPQRAGQGADLEDTGPRRGA
jgi:serine/threonine-protein kinase